MDINKQISDQLAFYFARCQDIKIDKYIGETNNRYNEQEFRYAVVMIDSPNEIVSVTFEKDNRSILLAYKHLIIDTSTSRIVEETLKARYIINCKVKIDLDSLQ